MLGACVLIVSQIGKCLLQLEECDIAIADARGNMPLHYLVRMRVREGDEEEYTSLVRSMIEQRKCVMITSHSNDRSACAARPCRPMIFVLHCKHAPTKRMHAALHLTTSLSRDLLNAENKKKETPLHLASLAHNDVAVVTLPEVGVGEEEGW